MPAPCSSESLSMPHFNGVYLTGTGAFYPGDAVDNDQIDDYVAPLNGASSRLKRRILAENGIQQRYYSTGPKGDDPLQRRTDGRRGGARLPRRPPASRPTRWTCSAPARRAATPRMPGFANMVQGELPRRR